VSDVAEPTADVLGTMASTVHALYLELQAAGFSEHQALLLLPPLGIHALLITERKRDG
jgi:hypothetical protein